MFVQVYGFHHKCVVLLLLDYTAALIKKSTYYIFWNKTDVKAKHFAYHYKIDVSTIL